MTFVERRDSPAASPVGLRKSGPATLIGYAAVFNSLSGDLGGFRERIAPGAFRDAIRRDDVRVLLNHDPNFVIGRTASGTLRLREDRVGLHIEIDADPDDPIVAGFVLNPIRRGDLTQMSFAFSLSRDGSGEDWSNVGGELVRTILKVDRLFDVSPVTYPAYDKTNIGLFDSAPRRSASGGRSAAQARRELEELIAGI